MTMRKTAIVMLALLPLPALADFDCTLLQQCGGGTCEDFTGGGLLLQEAGDVWQISIDGQKWDGYATTTMADAGAVSIVIPPVDGMSGLISVYPSGEAAFTVHAMSETGLVAITGTGNCAGEGG
jgi:hypothetical protein